MGSAPTMSNSTREGSSSIVETDERVDEGPVFTVGL